MSDRMIYIRDATARKLEMPEGREADVYASNAFLRTRRHQKHNRKYQRLLILMVLGSFLLAAVVTGRYAMIYEQTGQINTLAREYQDMRNTTIRLEAELENKLDLEQIRLLAETRLGMYKPGRNQYIFINLPQEDYVRSPGSMPSDNLFAALRNLFLSRD